MDIFTQGLVGASLAQSSAKKEHLTLATFIGFLAGLLPDADALIRSSQDSLLNIEYHRHFTHSVFFIPIGALIAALILWPFLKNKLDFKSLYIYALLGYCLSGFIDAATSYGTHLFWPVFDKAISFNIISIVDPVFTLILLISLGITLKKRSSRAIHIGLSLAAIYMLFGWFQLQKATEISTNLASERGHKIERLLVKPTLGNLVLWRSIYQAENKLYVDAIRVGIFNNKKVYPGESITLFNEHSDVNLPGNSVLSNDIRRFKEFSNNYLAILPENSNFLIDIRYSMLPNSLQPLWGIKMDVENPDHHAKYIITRSNNETVRKIFINMLLGKDLEEM